MFFRNQALNTCVNTIDSVTGKYKKLKSFIVARTLRKK